MTKTIKLTKGQETVVDDKNYEWLIAISSWCATKGHSGGYYALGWVDGRLQRMHKVIALREMGLEGEIDHRNRNSLDNQEHNLRVVTRSQNILNSKLSAANTSGYKGVSRHGPSWRAIIKINYVAIRLGTFKTKEEAYEARLDAEAFYGGAD